jgi:hypothetical protein
MDTAPEAAIGRRDDTFPADNIGEPKQPLGDEFGMFHHVGGVTDNARQNELAVRQLDVLPDRPFVLMADVTGFKRVGGN